MSSETSPPHSSEMSPPHSSETSPPHSSETSPPWHRRQCGDKILSNDGEHSRLTWTVCSDL